MRRLFFILLLLCFSGHVWGEVFSVIGRGDAYGYPTNLLSGKHFQSRDAACRAYWAEGGDGDPSHYWGVSNWGECVRYYSGSPSFNFAQTNYTTCPVGRHEQLKWFRGYLENASATTVTNPNDPPQRASFGGCEYQYNFDAATTSCYSHPDQPLAVFCADRFTSSGQEYAAAPPCDNLSCVPPPPAPTCSNGATDYPTCTPPPPSTCSNGATDYPTCTPPSGGDTGGGDTGGGDTGGGGAGTCSNGGIDYPTCTDPGTGGGTGTCSNGATNYPTCTTGGTGGGTGGDGDTGGTITGACADIVCSGDAISCAIAKEAAMANCIAKEQANTMLNSAEYRLAKAVMDGADPDAANLPNKANAGSWVMPSSFDSAGWLGAGACFSDKSFTVQGYTVVIPFSNACNYLIVFRYVIMIIAAWISFRMLSGVILRD